MIQGSINQLLQLATIAAKLDPNSEKRAAIYQNKQKSEILNKKSAEIEESANEIEKEGTEFVKTSVVTKDRRMKQAFKQFGTSQLIEAEKERAELHGAVLSEQTANAKELFDLDPTQKNYENYRSLQLEKDFYSTSVEKGGGLTDPYEEATRKADEALKAEQKRVRSAKRAMKRPGGID